MKLKSLILLSSLLFILLASTIALAKPDRQRRGPPPEAFEACKDKALGDEITFTTGRGDELSATCQYAPDDESVLVAMPKDHIRPNNNN